MMKTRDYRNLKVGSFYHIYNRGNRKQVIFHDEADYEYFINKLFTYAQTYKQKIVNYAVMDNHYHVTFFMQDPSEFSKMMRLWGSMASRHYNKKYKTVGHMFQDKYKHRLLINPYDLIHTSSYIHRNPFPKRGIIPPASEQWSSLSAYISKSGHDELSRNLHSQLVLKYFKNADAYTKFIYSNDEQEQLSGIRSEVLHLDMIKAVDSNFLELLFAK